MTRLETPRLVLRPFEEGDAEEAFRWFGDPLVMKFMTSGPDATLADTERRIAKYRQHQAVYGFSKWLILDRASGMPIGDSGLMVLEHEGWVDLGYRLIPARWGRGLATEAASAWVDAAFNQLGIRVLGAFTHHENHASVRVLEKLQFRRLRADTVMGMPAVVFELERLVRSR